MAHNHEGIVRRELISGPVESVPLILDQPEEGKVSLDLLLRPFIGAYVKITIEKLYDEGDEDGEGELRASVSLRHRRHRIRASRYHRKAA